MLTDGDVFNTVLLPEVPVGRDTWIQFEFDEPQTVQSVTVTFTGGPNNKTLEVSNYGSNFTKVIDMIGLQKHLWLSNVNFNKLINLY